MTHHPFRFRFNPQWLFAIIGCCLLTLFETHSPAYGSNRGTITVPQPLPGQRAAGFSKKSGLQLMVDASWVGENGYRPVRLTFTSSKPLAAECQGSIRFRGHAWGRTREGALSVEKGFVLPLGSTSTSLTLFFPELQYWDSYTWDTWIDGEIDNELSMSQGSLQQAGNEVKAAVLLLTSEYRGGLLLSQLPIETGDVFDCVLQYYSEIADDRLLYSGVDVVAMYLPDLVLMQEFYPEKFKTLLRWIRLGGNLCVFQVDKVYSDLNKIDELLGAVDIRAENDAAISAGTWRQLELRDDAESAENQLLELLSPQPPLGIDKLVPSQFSMQQPRASTSSLPWFVVRGFGMGTVTAFRDIKASSRRSTNRRLRDLLLALERSQLANRFSYDQRLGNNPKTGNKQFYDWHIPDVGTAPVLEFQFLISLFVIVIGPLNYWLLKRSKQLPLLLVTVPMIAIGTTLFLFAYGFLADGVGVRVRVRSFTYLDQKAEEAACWARLSYYAGIAPSKGLHFPEDTEVYPITAHRYRRSSRAASVVRELEWESEQHLKRGWLSSRTPTQYQTLTARSTAKHLEFAFDGLERTVKNQLGTDVLFLGVKDHEGNWFLGEDIPIHGTKKLEASDQREIMSRLRLFSIENAPEFPQGFSKDRKAGTNAESDSYFSGNLMETRVRALFSPAANIWEKGSYVAITRTGLEVSLGLEEITETESYHVIQGSW